jgi:CMP-N,N'-diacetyllegionaminic acid synthase
MSEKRVLCIIPARGGSHGLPGKNIRPLVGLPLIAHSLECARMCKEITRTIVSTDSEEIAKVAREHGGDVPFLRPADLAGDATPMAPVLAHATKEIERLEAEAAGTGRSAPYDVVILFDPTSPGRLPSDVTQAVALLDSDASAQGVIAVSKPTFNPFWVGVVEKDGAIVPAFDTSKTYERRQDVPVFRRINGSLYVWRRDYVVNHTGPWHAARQLPLEIPESRAFSIDDLYEFQVAELLLTSGLLTLPWLPAKS